MAVNQYNTESVKERLLAFVSPEPNSGCWLWLGCTNHKGYGKIRVGSKQEFAHRVSYEIHTRQIPDGLQIDHLCRVRCCVNPDHLEPVTAGENIRRGETGKHRGKHRGGRRKSDKAHCPQGHPYDESNSVIYGKKRICRMCQRASGFDKRRRAGMAVRIFKSNQH